MSTPLISVVVPVYNAARYVESALKSVQDQTLGDFELIAVDDGSTDESKRLLDALAARDPRLVVISRPNTGIVGALNDGLKAARGEFIARMDADDLCTPDRFATQVDYLRQHPACVCVGSAFTFMDAAGFLLKECARAQTHAEIERELLNGNGGSIIHPAALFRRQAVEKVGGYREEAQWIEDLDLYLRLALVGELANHRSMLLYYRLHEQSVNFTRNKGRYERKLRILAEAYARRSLAFDPKVLPLPTFRSAISSEELRDFAVTSLKYGRRGRPWYYACRAVRADPRNAQTWRVLSYVAKARFGLIRG